MRRHSVEHRAQARDAISEFNIRRHQPPWSVCGAKRRSAEGFCQQPVGPGKTRCRFHGGAVPKRPHWHTPLWPNPTGPNASARFDKKLAELEARQERQAARIAGMSVAELAKYQAWTAAHRPGPAAPRAARRQTIKARQVLAAAAAKQAPPAPPDLFG